MPLYMCNAVRGTIPEAAKQKIAADFTDIHCQITGAPRTFVHVFFFEDAPQLPVNGKRVFLFGSIRAGRTGCAKTPAPEPDESVNPHTFKCGTRRDHR